jgi:hypothetical protein
MMSSIIDLVVRNWKRGVDHLVDNPKQRTEWLHNAAHCCKQQILEQLEVINGANLAQGAASAAGSSGADRTSSKQPAADTAFGPANRLPKVNGRKPSLDWLADQGQWSYNRGPAAIVDMLQLIARGREQPLSNKIAEGTSAEELWALAMTAVSDMQFIWDPTLIAEGSAGFWCVSLFPSTGK